MTAFEKPAFAEPTYEKPLLGPDFATQTKDTFLAHVSAMRKLPQNRVKASRPKRPKLKGKVTYAGTAAKRGSYEVTFGELRATFAFDAIRSGTPKKVREKKLTAEDFAGLYDALKLDAKILRKFLEAKKFTLPA